MIESKKALVEQVGRWGTVADGTGYRSTCNLLLLDRNAVIEEDPE